MSNEKKEKYIYHGGGHTNDANIMLYKDHIKGRRLVENKIAYVSIHAAHKKTMVKNGWRWNKGKSMWYILENEDTDEKLKQAGALIPRNKGKYKQPTLRNQEPVGVSAAWTDYEEVWKMLQLKLDSGKTWRLECPEWDESDYIRDENGKPVDFVLSEEEKEELRKKIKKEKERNNHYKPPEETEAEKALCVSQGRQTRYEQKEKYAFRN